MHPLVYRRIFEAISQTVNIGKMLVHLRNLTPPLPCGPALVDDIGLPRFWAAVWASYLPADLAPATVAKKLGQLERLYQHADALLGPGGLDNALVDFDITVLCDVLEGFFFSIKNAVSITAGSENCWQTALQFVSENLQRRSRNCAEPNRLEEFRHKLKVLELTHAKLHIGRRCRPERVRSLPADVVEYLYHLLDPTSSINPFQNKASRWRVYITFILMLHQGLRRGELLTLPVDAVKSSYDHTQNRSRNWINVKYNEYEDDTRYSRPGIKNASSIRQLPVSNTVASIVQEYVVNHRGRVSHSFLVNSQKRQPLSPEGVTGIFKKVSASLPMSLRKSLKDHTGVDSISAHDLRHTCAVVRLNQLLSTNVEMNDALQRMRAFFGWSRESDMPLRYARAVFEDRLSSIWKDEFDDRVSMLRSLPVRSK